jgi:hypothetical protein
LSVGTVLMLLPMHDSIESKHSLLENYKLYRWIHRVLVTGRGHSLRG